jgi:hypothetical protein
VKSRSIRENFSSCLNSWNSLLGLLSNWKVIFSHAHQGNTACSGKTTKETKFMWQHFSDLIICCNFTFTFLVLSLCGLSMFKTLHVSAWIGRPQVLKIVYQENCCYSRHSCFVPLSSVCLFLVVFLLTCDHCKIATSESTNKYSCFQTKCVPFDYLYYLWIFCNLKGNESKWICYVCVTNSRSLFCISVPPPWLCQGHEKSGGVMYPLNLDRRKP